MKHFSFFAIFIILFSFSSFGQNPVAWKWAKSDTSLQLNLNQSFIKEVVGAKNNRILHAALKNSKVPPYHACAYGDYSLAEYDTSGNVMASRVIKGHISLKEIQADAAGNWYVFGSVYDTVDFGNGNVFTTDRWSEGIYYIFKLHAGTLMMDWCKKISYSPLTTGNCITVQGDKLYAVTDSGYSSRIYKLSTATGASSLFLTQVGNSKISSIQADNKGNLYVGGYSANPYANGICFNGTVSIPTGIADYQTYIVRYKANGQHDWHIWMPDNLSCARKLTVATNNLIYYSGALHDTMTFGGIYIKKPYMGAGFMLARLDSTGSVAWVRQAKDSTAGNVLMEHSCNAAVNADSSITIFANVQGSVDWGNGITSTAPTGDLVSTAACVHFKADGTVVWVKQITGREVYAQQIASGNTDVFVTGIARDSFAIQFDGIALPQTMKYSPYIARLTTGVKIYTVAEGPHGSPTGIDNTNHNLIVMMQPNPATNLISVSGLENTHEPVWMAFVDMSGKMVFEKTIAATSNAEQIDVSQYARGMYVLQVRSGQLKYSGKVLLR